MKLHETIPYGLKQLFRTPLPMLLKKRRLSPVWSRKIPLLLLDTKE